jgi:hypothetical protein
MAARKQFLASMPVDADLKALLDDARSKSVTEEQLHEQRISFAFGNAPDSEFITKDTVRAASRKIRLEAEQE